MSAVGLDCEWRPTAYGVGGTDKDKDTVPLGEKDSYPVATLQLAFRDEVFIIDMLTLSGSAMMWDDVHVDSNSVDGDGGSNGGNSRSISSVTVSGSGGGSDGESGRDSNIAPTLTTTSTTRKTAQSGISRPKIPGTLTQEEESLSSSLGELFAHQKIAILGFAVQQDLQKLSASYPHLICFQRVMHVIDLAPLSKAAFPQVCNKY